MNIKNFLNKIYIKNKFFEQLKTQKWVINRILSGDHIFVLLTFQRRIYVNYIILTHLIHCNSWWSLSKEWVYQLTRNCDVQQHWIIIINIY